MMFWHLVDVLFALTAALGLGMAVANLVDTTIDARIARTRNGSALRMAVAISEVGAARRLTLANLLCVSLLLARLFRASTAAVSVPPLTPLNIFLTLAFYGIVLILAVNPWIRRNDRRLILRQLTTTEYIARLPPLPGWFARLRAYLAKVIH